MIVIISENMRSFQNAFYHKRAILKTFRLIYNKSILMSGIRKIVVVKNGRFFESHINILSFWILMKIFQIGIVLKTKVGKPKIHLEARSRKNRIALGKCIV